MKKENNIEKNSIKAITIGAEVICDSKLPYKFTCKNQIKYDETFGRTFLLENKGKYNKELTWF